MIKGIRRSIKGDKSHSFESKLSHLSITPKAAESIQPPKKVIKALYDYQPTSEQELAFNKGDFFHVVANENDPDWYEACNPATGARGLVPVTFFQVLGKSERDSADSGKSLGSIDRTATDTDSGYSDGAKTFSHLLAPRRKSVQDKAGGPLYGIVQYDFVAERPDELDAKAGEAIIVIAQSNKEWFVAKPIGRLGGPGLIPVDFIEIRDMTTGKPCEDKEEAIRRAGVPKVEEWKKRIAEYKNSSISLGKFASEEASSQSHQHNGGVEQQPHDPIGESSRHSRNGSAGLGPAPISASVDDYNFEGGRYWYLVNCTMEDGQHWSLCRFYEDFYDCQIALLKAFPEEAGQTNRAVRTLPFMPGPVTFVTDSISSARRASLDEYIKKLLEMPPHISKCSLIRELFTPRPGDVEQPYPQHKRLSQNSYQHRNSTMSQQSSDSSREPSRQSSTANLNGNHGGLNVSQSRHSAGRQNTLGQAHQVHMRTVSDIQPPRMLRNDSSQSSQQNLIKIKISYQDEMIAILFPREVTFAQLQEKLQERLQSQWNCIQYKDEPTGTLVNMLSDNDLQIALTRNPKLILYVS